MAGGMNRRDFLKRAGLASAGVATLAVVGGGVEAGAKVVAPEAWSPEAIAKLFHVPVGIIEPPLAHVGTMWFDMESGGYMYFDGDEWLEMTFTVTTP